MLEVILEDPLLEEKEFFIKACWVICTTRNSVAFYNGQINVNLWKRHFKEELGLVCAKAKPAR
jgi:hypothetical protein